MYSHQHVNHLIRVQGVVTRRSTVIPQLRMVTYACIKCDYLIGPFAQNGIDDVKPARCAACQSKGPFIVKSDRSAYRDYQRLTLQESPGQVPPGRLPRHKDVILMGDLVDSVRPGEEIVCLKNLVLLFILILIGGDGYLSQRVRCHAECQQQFSFVCDGR